MIEGELPPGEGNKPLDKTTQEIGCIPAKALESGGKRKQANTFRVEHLSIGDEDDNPSLSISASQGSERMKLDWRRDHFVLDVRDSEFEVRDDAVISTIFGELRRHLSSGGKISNEASGLAVPTSQIPALLMRSFSVGGEQKQLHEFQYSFARPRLFADILPPLETTAEPALKEIVSKSEMADEPVTPSLDDVDAVEIPRRHSGDQFQLTELLHPKFPFDEMNLTMVDANALNPRKKGVFTYQERTGILNETIVGREGGQDVTKTVMVEDPNIARQVFTEVHRFLALARQEGGTDDLSPEQIEQFLELNVRVRGKGGESLLSATLGDKEFFDISNPPHPLALTRLEQPADEVETKSPTTRKKRSGTKRVRQAGAETPPTPSEPEALPAPPAPEVEVDEGTAEVSQVESDEGAGGKKEALDPEKVISNATKVDPDRLHGGYTLFETYDGTNLITYEELVKIINLINVKEEPGRPKELQGKKRLHFVYGILANMHAKGQLEIFGLDEDEFKRRFLANSKSRDLALPDGMAELSAPEFTTHCFALLRAGFERLNELEQPSEGEHEAPSPQLQIYANKPPQPGCWDELEFVSQTVWSEVQAFHQALHESIKPDAAADHLNPEFSEILHERITQGAK